MSRYITVPDAITMTDFDGNAIAGAPPKTFARWLAEAPCNSPAVHTNIQSLQQTLALLDAANAANVGFVIAVDDDYWAKLTDAVNWAITSVYSPYISRQLMPFMQAILNAPNTKP